MENNEYVKKHYNKMPNRSISERKLTRNINIRNTHNYIKFCLFKDFIKPRNTVLDLGVGKGGDFGKYQSSRISELYGVDIANRSIVDAIQRAREMNPEFKVILKTRDCYTKDLELNRKFDIISIQFSFHYCFAEERYLDTTLSNISKHLARNGYVLITMPCKEEILRRKESGTLSNRFYSIQFKSQDSSEVYGNAYSYSLVDSVNDCTEYLVDMGELTRKMESKGLELVRDTPFEEYYNGCLQYYSQACNRMRIRSLNKDEMEVMTLHHVVVYKNSAKS